MNRKVEVSIIIPTYSYSDRGENLCKLITVLKNQLINNVYFEIIIVDNGCSLDELLLIKKFQDDKHKLVIVREPTIGLSKAKNCGILKSTGQIIVFLDDDMITTNGWLESIVKAHQRLGVICVGGPILIKNREALIFPKWFSEYFLRFVLPPKYPKNFSKVIQPFYLGGANISFKKEVFTQHGLYDTSLGRKGKKLLSGEDTEFMIRLNPDEVYFEPEAKVYTYIKTRQLTRDFFLKRIFWQAISEAKIVRKHSLSKLYDKQELYFSSGFISFLINSLSSFCFFKSVCIITRFITFKTALFFKL